MVKLKSMSDGRFANTGVGGRHKNTRSLEYNAMVRMDRSHLIRLQAQVRLIAQGKPMPDAPNDISARIFVGKLIGDDHSGTSLKFFCSHSLAVGQDLMMDIPSYSGRSGMSIPGRVMWCEEKILDAHVVTQTPFIYEMEICFISSEEPGKSESIRDYTKELYDLAGIPREPEEKAA